MLLAHEVRGKSPLQTCIVVRHGLINRHIGFALALHVLDEIDHIEPLLSRKITAAAACETALIENAVHVGDNAKQGRITQWSAIVLKIRYQPQGMR